MNNKTIKKILIIGSEVKPIPATKGGAVEVLIEHIINANETNKFAELTIASPLDEESKCISKKYKNTNFIFIKKTKSFFAFVVDSIDLFSRRFFRKTTGTFYINSVCRIIKNKDFDLIIIENRPLYGKAIKTFFKGPLYLHLHNDFVNNNSSLLNEIINKYDKYIVISDYLKKRILEVENANVEVVHNGVELKPLPNGKKQNSKTKKILYAGRLVKEKGIIELVNAFMRLKSNNIELDIIGEYDFGAENEESFKKELELLVSKNINIKLIGYIPNAKIQEYYYEGYVGVVPSLVNEALSLTAIEMIASGLPVICTNAGGLPEVIDNSCGVIVERNNLEENLYNSLNSLLSSNNIRDQLSIGAITKSKEFDLQNYIKNIKKSLLEDLNYD